MRGPTTSRSKSSGPRIGSPFAARCRKTLLDRELPTRHGNLLGQLQFEHAVVVLRLAGVLVELRRQREAAIDVSVVALGTQYALAIPGFVLALHFGSNRDLVAFHR